MEREISLRKRVAVVTGGSRGIGKAVAAALLRDGAWVAIAARSAEELESAARELEGTGRVIAVRTDVSNRNEIDRLVRKAAQTLGPIDILVNAAAVQEPVGVFIEADFDAWVRNVQIGLFGTAYCCKAVLPGMIERKRGKIVNFSGGGATGPRPNFSAYAVSKTGVVRFTETLAEEVRHFGIQVNGVSPGMIKTKMLDGILEAGPEKAGRDYEQVRGRAAAGFDSAEDAAELVRWLASDDSNWLTGKLISAVWDPWREWREKGPAAMEEDMYALRRIDGQRFFKRET